MAAIDLLMNWSPRSERMHQIVLAGLFQHTPLLSVLGWQEPPTSLTLETQDRLYDFTLEFESGPPVHVELKIDSALDASQIKRQLQALQPGETMLYVLLGITRFSWTKARLESVCTEVNRSFDPGSIRFIDLPQIRQAMSSLATHANNYDHRDLAVAYESLLRRIDEEGSGYLNMPLAAWRGAEWYRFFGAMINRLKLADAGVGYVPNPRHGFIGCWWHFLTVPQAANVKAYLQCEEDRLCFKINLPDEESCADIRNRFSGHVLAAARHSGLPAVRPNRFGKGRTMTVALFDGDYRSSSPNGLLDLENVESVVRDAERILSLAVRDCEFGTAD